MIVCWSWSSIVSIVTEVWAGCSGVQIQAGARDFFLLQYVQTDSGAHSATYSVGTGVQPWE
jgi:hypothetical protein